MKNLVRGLVCTSFILLFAGQAMAQPAGTTFTRLFQCDGPSNTVLRDVGALVVERPVDPKYYRQPRIILNFRNGTRQTFRVTSAGWRYENPLVEGDVVFTLFSATNNTLGVNPAAIQLQLRSNGSFQPLSGTLSGLTTTFRTCGVQSTSAYYWTRSSMNRIEAFACPELGKPPGCPGIGPN